MVLRSLSTLLLILAATHGHALDSNSTANSSHSVPSPVTENRIPATQPRRTNATQFSRLTEAVSQTEIPTQTEIPAQTEAEHPPQTPKPTHNVHHDDNDDDMPQGNADGSVRISNINYVGRGYDILYGNPRPTAATGIDPGWKDGIFEQTWDQARIVRIGDQDVEVPEDHEILDSKNCEISFSSSNAMTATQWKNDLEASVSGSFKGWGAAFKASASYQEVEERFEERNTLVIESSAKCSTYRVSVSNNFTPKLKEEFAGAVSLLPRDYAGNEAAYLGLIRDFGTHYSRRVTLGAIAGIRREITESALETLKIQGVDIDAEMEYAATVASASAEVSWAEETENKANFDSKMSQETQFAYGGTFFGGDDGVSRATAAEEWYQAAKAQGLPLDFELEMITSVLTPTAFPDDPYIWEKQESLARALIDYCGFLGEQGELGSCSNRVYDLNTTARVGGNDETGDFDDRIPWQTLGHPMPQHFDVWFHENGYLSGVQAGYVNPGEAATLLPARGASKPSEGVQRFELEPTPNGGRDPVTAATVCTYRGIGPRSVETDLIGSLKFDTKSGRSKTFYSDSRTYRYFSEGKNWQDALDHCRSLNGDLASPRNDAEVEELGIFHLEQTGGCTFVGPTTALSKGCTNFEVGGSIQQHQPSALACANSCQANMWNGCDAYIFYHDAPGAQTGDCYLVKNCGTNSDVDAGSTNTIQRIIGDCRDLSIDVWTGLNDLADEGTFVWSGDSSHEIAITVIPEGDRDCVRRTMGNGVFDAAKCHWTYPYVCQVPTAFASENKCTTFEFPDRQGMLHWSGTLVQDTVESLAFSYYVPRDIEEEGLTLDDFQLRVDTLLPPGQDSGATSALAGTRYPLMLIALLSCVAIALSTEQF